MPAAGSASTATISWSPIRSIAASEDKHDVIGREIRRRAGESRQRHHGQDARRRAGAGGRGAENVPHQSAGRAQGRGTQTRRRLGRYAGAVPDRQEIRRRRPRRRLDRAQARRAPREPPPSPLRRVFHRAQGPRPYLYRGRRSGVRRRRRDLFAARLLARLQQHVGRGRGAGLGLDGRRLDRGLGLRSASGQPQMKLWEDPRVAKGMTAQLAARRQRLAAGEKPLGWKMGFGAPGAMKLLQTSGPLSGYLLQSALLSSGATVDVKGWTQLVAEPEIGVRLGADLPTGGDAAAAPAAIASLTPAIELADLDLAGGPDAVEPILSRNIFQRRVLLSAQSRDGGDTAGLVSRVFRRGKLAAETAEPEALTGKVADLLVHLADMLGAFGERLRAGDLVICGSTVPPPLIEADEVEFRHALEPIGNVAVRFTR